MNNKTDKMFSGILMLASKKGDQLFGNDVSKQLADIIGNKDNSPGCLTLIVLVFFLALSLPITYLWSGFILMMLWNWFMPMIGAVEINQPTAMGLLSLSYFFKIGLKQQEPDKDTAKTNISLAIIIPIISYWVIGLFMLVIGWCIHLFA